MSDIVHDLVVVGAGPVGAHTAGAVAGAGFSVLLVEEHERVGEPVQCAGLITTRVFDIVPETKGAVLNKVSGARIFSPSGKTLEIGGDRTRAVVIDRAEFDRAVAAQAADRGAEILTGRRVKDIGRHDFWELDLGGGEVVRARLLVGADGYGSLVRRRLGLNEPSFLLNGYGEELEGAEF
jgi:digeranylgeranylglycerophospholipid reductase